ncbi:MAG TPA: CDP-archaeol synthase [Nitrococcus sp.]|nr:CDP-archaeol synthase [Nitrococcus sp.]
MPIVDLLILLVVANGAPIVAHHLFGARFTRPLDGGRHWLDGRPIFGRAKTLRGIFFALLVTALAAPLLGYDACLGLGVAALAMAGDLLSSFLKRRMGLASSGMALGLDQIPESLLPAWVLRGAFGLDGRDALTVSAVFFLLELLLSALLYAIGLRKQPY